MWNTCFNWKFSNLKFSSSSASNIKQSGASIDLALFFYTVKLFGNMEVSKKDLKITQLRKSIFKMMEWCISFGNPADI